MHRSFTLRGVHAASAVALILASACAPGAEPPPAAAADAGPLYRYSCPDGFQFDARFGEEVAVLTLNGTMTALPQVISASGARFAAGDILFWIKGNEARLELGSTVREACEATLVEES